MPVNIEVFEWEKEDIEEIINKFPFLKGRFSPKKKRLKFPTIKHYECFNSILKLGLKEVIKS